MFYSIICYHTQTYHEVINFTVITYEQMNDNCINANTWSFYSTFIFVGSVATTIGKVT